MKQINPSRNSLRRFKAIRSLMFTPRIGRRRILRRLSGGGAVAWTSLTGIGRSAAQTSMPHDTAHPRPLILLDPGHGGYDPGTSGVTGTLEKDVTLASALALKAVLEQSGRYRVELTRSGDQYVALGDRVRVAQDLGASLVLSMHANEVSDRSVRGASVYTLAKSASDAETAALADRENGLVAGQAGHSDHMAPEVSEILASLAARETRAASARIAHQLVRDFRHRLPVLSSPERHANFVVLHAADIPSVLIEMGFLSNAEDEAALNDPQHRALIASAVTRAVDAWFAAPHDEGFL
jgi:N-acetylmuramoyl-L-alanine amidase